MSASPLDAVVSEFRLAMRRLAATVCVLTCRTGAEAFGMTATAVTSLSMDPPALLACVNRSASIHAHLTAGRLFCVNLLEAGHVDVARAFSSGPDRAQRFATGNWESHARDVPVLRDAQAWMLCAVEQVVDYATHSIVIGRVLEAQTDPARLPLVYLEGNFAAPAQVRPLLTPGSGEA